MAELFKKYGVYQARLKAYNPKTDETQERKRSTGIKVDGTRSAKEAAQKVADQQEEVWRKELRDGLSKSTLSDAFEGRSEQLRVRRAPSNSVEVMRQARAHMYRLLGQKTPCRNVDNQATRKLADTLLSEGRAVDTVRRYLVELRTAFKSIGEPAPEMPDFPSPKYREGAVSLADIKRICAELRWKRARVLLLVHQTGCRRNEVYKIRRLAPGLGRIEGSEGLKTGPRTIPLTALAEKILAEGPLEEWPGSLKRLKAAAKRAGVVGLVNWNNVRAGTATHLLQADVPPARIAALLGHKSLSMVQQRYARLKNLNVSAEDLKSLDVEES